MDEQIKSSFSVGGRHKKFWDELVANPVYPISDAEVDISDVSAANANKFYAVNTESDILASQKMAEAVEEDLFDDLE